MHPGVIITSALALVIGLAIVSVLVSKQSQTPSVISTAGAAFAQIIGAATAPVTGATGGSSLLSTAPGSFLTNPAQYTSVGF